MTGGQTGVDMAALEFAHRNGILYGGWVPKGRTNEAGLIPDHFGGLIETNSEDVAERTRLNVNSSDATLVIVDGSSSPGTRQTVAFAAEAKKPHLVLDIRQGVATSALQVVAWLEVNPVSVLNIAGPRASEAPGLAPQVQQVLEVCRNQFIQPR